MLDGEEMGEAQRDMAIATVIALVGATQPFTEDIGLETVRWRFQHPEPQMANPLV